jgi:hypothetical protein
MFARRLLLRARPEAITLVLECERRIVALTAAHVACRGLVWQHSDAPELIESWLLFANEHSHLAARAALEADTALHAAIAVQRAGLDEDEPILDSAELRLAGDFALPDGPLWG